MDTHERRDDGAEPSVEQSRDGSLPDDAAAPPAQQQPHDATEAAADRDMAEAEEAVGRHSGSQDQRDSVSAMASERGQEDRRRVWIDRHRDGA